MAQIKKEQRESRNSKITSLTAENDNLFQSADVDQSRKNQAKAVIDFAQQVMNAEEFTGRDSAIYNLGIQEAVNKILKGEQAYSESMTGGAKTNIFGYYSRHGAPSELDWMINETVKRAISGNIQQTAQNQQSATHPVSDVKQIVKFTPSAGFSSYVLPTTTLNDKVNKFAKYLSSQLENYINNPYDESKYIVQGLNKDSIQNFANYKATLDTIAGRQAAPQDILSIGDIVSALGNEGLTEAFEEYFANELAGEDQEQKGDSMQRDHQEQTIVQNQSSSESQEPTVSLTDTDTNQDDLETKLSDVAVDIKDLSDSEFAFLWRHLVVSAPFTKQILMNEILSEQNKDPKESLIDFVKLYTLAESGDTKSLYEIKKRFGRIDEEHSGYAIGDRIIQRLRKHGVYNRLLKSSINNSKDDKEKGLLISALEKTGTEINPLITKHQFPIQEQNFIQTANIPHYHRTQSEKQGGKLDKLQNYISNKNGN